MIYRTEHPRPGFRRDNWENLNGKWDFAIDHGDSGEARKWYATDAPADAFDKVIEVPFCPESRLSGVEYKDFMSAVWYRRTVTVTAEDLQGIVTLQFGAVDWFCKVWVNGEAAGEHAGGYVSFAFDITKYLKPGENLLVVRARDNTRNPMIPRGKQSEEFYSHGCDYTRTTGIWQTVWLEKKPKNYIDDITLTPVVETASVMLRAIVCGQENLSVTVKYDGREMACAALQNVSGDVTLCLPLKEAHLWEIGAGRLYDVELRYGDDVVNSYFGLRKIEYRDKKFYLNGKSVYQRLVLDQGFYPDGVYTAPSDDELLADVKRSQAMGFNGARLHEKVFEERFLYHCDTEGYIVWGEYPNWGLDHTRPEAVHPILSEWLCEIKRDKNHPSIVGWCPYNETWDKCGTRQCDDVLASVFYATKAADPTRPCIDTSGNYHVGQLTDIYDVHEYEQNVEKMTEIFRELAECGAHKDKFAPRQNYLGDKPFFVSEYGGIRWSNKDGWGYGEAPKSEDEFLTRLEGLTNVLLDNPNIFAYCYTQLTDVEQEQNGLYTYDRKAKFPPEVIAKILGKKAAVEKE